MERLKKEDLQKVFNEPGKHLKAIKAFEECYNGLQIGNYDQEVIEDILINGTSNIEVKFKETAEKQLDKSGITSPLLKANLLAGCNAVLDQFKTKFDGLIDSQIELVKQAKFDSITANQMKISFMGIMGNSISHVYDTHKILIIGGNGAGFITACNKSFDFNYSDVKIKPGDKEYYIYAKVPRNENKGTLLAFNEPQANTNEHFFILWQSGTFNQIKF